VKKYEDLKFDFEEKQRKTKLASATSRKAASEQKEQKKNYQKEKRKNDRQKIPQIVSTLRAATTEPEILVDWYVSCCVLFYIHSIHILF
jgi:hypothetical protein